MINKNNKIVSLDGNGLVYSTNYISGFVTYSLVDKNYVDHIISSVPVLGVTAGNGLTAGGTGSFISLGVNVSNGIVIIDDSVQLASTVSGNGLTYSTGVIDINTSNGITIINDSVQLADTVSGNGLTYSAGVIDVNVSNGVTIIDDSVQLASTISGNGLTYSAGVIDVNTSNGVTIIDDSVQLAQTVSGNGLTYSAGVIDVNTSNGVTIIDDSVQLASSVSGNGLTYSAGVIDINTSNGIAIINDSVQLAQTVSGNGLTYSSGVIDINTSNGVTIIDDSVQLAQTVSGNGLTYSAGVIDVNVNSDSIEISGDSLRLKNTITGDRTFGDSVTINGNLIVSGTASYVYTDDLYVKDNIVMLNATWSGAPLLDSGLMINRGSSQSARLIWNESVDYWQLGMSGSESTIITERGTGLSKTGNMLEVNYSEVPRKYAEYGLSLTANVVQAINHNIGTASVVAQAWDISTGENLNLVFKNRQSNSLDILSTVSVVVDVIIIG